MSRIVDIEMGRVMAVTDLHGAYSVYRRYRDLFLDLRARGEADYLLLCGDLIHSYGPLETDGSLELMLDLLRLRHTLGHQLIVLLGNHELPHLYGLILSKDGKKHTPRFEKTMSEAQRAVILPFLESLPFYARTRAGVSFAHAGACQSAYTLAAWEQLVNYSHAAERAKAEEVLARENRESLRAGLAKLNNESYARIMADNFGLTDPTHPRYDDFLRGILTQSLSAPLEGLWEALFTQNERGSGLAYSDALLNFLTRMSHNYARQNYLVTGHMPVRGGHAVVARRQLRLASWTHATPNESAQYLLLDADKPVPSLEALTGNLKSLFE